MNNIYYIGGSPCCGKSTIAELLVKEFGFKYYKCDDHLDRYLKLGVKDNNKTMVSIANKTIDEIWLSDIKEQVEEEFEFYRYALKVIENDLENDYKEENIIIEGAVLLPEYIESKSISNDRYICMVPTRDFQLDKYGKREWVKDYLRECSDIEQAFKNWMKRDFMFANIVKSEALRSKRNVIEVDGSKTIDQIYSMVKSMFKLEG